MNKHELICTLCGESHFEVTEIKQEMNKELSDVISFSAPLKTSLYKHQCLCCGKIELFTRNMKTIAKPLFKWTKEGSDNKYESIRFNGHEAYVHMDEGSNKGFLFFKRKPTFTATLNLNGSSSVYKKKYCSLEEAKQWCEKWLQYH